MTRTLSEAQVQTLLQYLFSEQCSERLDAIRYVVTLGLHDEQLLLALEELAAFDTDEDVRRAARKAVGIAIGLQLSLPMRT